MVCHACSTFPAPQPAFLLDRISMLARWSLARFKNTRPRTSSFSPPRLSLWPRSSFCLIAVFLTVFGPLPAYPQASTPSDGVIAGTVVDPSGALVPGALLTLAAPGQPPLTSHSNAGGTFRFPDLPAAIYTLTVQARGFGDFRRENLLLQSGQTLRLEVSLKIDIQREQIAVSSEELDASPDQSLGAIVLGPTDLDALPTNPIDLQTQLQLIAGSDPTTPPELFVDGFTATRLPPKSSIREIRINQNPYSAQYDATGLGRIEVLTKPGSEKLHGSLTLLGDDSVLNSSNPYTIGQPPYSAF
jgi:hypothetical protein